MMQKAVNVSKQCTGVSFSFFLSSTRILATTISASFFF
jgi:hypothetical protein